MSRFFKFGKLHVTKGNGDKLLDILLTASKKLKRSLAPTGNLGYRARIRNHVIAVSCVKLLSAHNSTQHTSRKHKV